VIQYSLILLKIYVLFDIEYSEVIQNWSKKEILTA